MGGSVCVCVCVRACVCKWMCRLAGWRVHAMRVCVSVCGGRRRWTGGCMVGWVNRRMDGRLGGGAVTASVAGWKVGTGLRVRVGLGPGLGLAPGWELELGLGLELRLELGLVGGGEVVSGGG